MSDFNKIAEFGLRDLYLKMTKIYSESLKSDASINENLVNWFTTDIEGTAIDGTEAINQFRDFALVAPNGLPREFTSNNEINVFLADQYIIYGIVQPPEGFLDIDSGTTNWWDNSIASQNDYFIQTHIFDIDDVFITPFNLKLGENAVIPWDNPDGPLPTAARELLVELTKERYLTDNPDTQLTDADISNDYFFILDVDQNSLHYIVDGTTGKGKLYVRVFFNIYGQKLATSVVDITGIAEARKVPSGIRKSFLIKNFSAAIKKIEKFFNENKKNFEKPEKTEKNIQRLNQVNDIILGIMEKKGLNSNSRISFIFNEEYRFLVLVDGNNIPISGKPLKEFLKEVEFNQKYIANLNTLSCFVGGGPVDDSPAQSTSQIEQKEYEHFIVDPPELSEKEKVANFNSQQNKMEFIGDIGIKLILEEIQKNSVEGATFVDLYNKFFNKVDYLKLAESAVSSIASQLPALEIKRTKFESFITSLDLTELVDCVIEQAGALLIPPSQEAIETAQEAGTGEALPSVEMFFFGDLKLVVYGGFAFHYNVAKQYDSATFNYPASGEQLPYAPDLDENIVTTQEEIKNAETALVEAQNQVAKIDKELADAEKEVPPDIPEEPLNITELKEQQEIALVNQLNAEEVLEQAKVNYLDAQVERDEYINKNFPYVLLVPQEQTEKIYDTITTNVPQYRNNPDLIETGFSKIQFEPGFQPKDFVTFLTRKRIIDYANSLNEEAYNGLYSNLAAANAKLREEGSEAETESGLDSSDKSIINATATINNQTLPAVPTFDWFGVREPTTDYSKFIGNLLNSSYDKALGTILSLLVNTIVSELGKVALGDLGILDKIDPGLKSLIAANSVTQNALDSTGNNINSPEELYETISKENGIDIDILKCALKRISSDIPLSDQVKYMRFGIDPGDSSVIILQNLFSNCGFPADDLSVINNIFSSLNDLIDADLLEAKIAMATKTLQEYMDICTDNDQAYLDNLKNLLSEDAAQKQIDNETREAIQKLKDFLSMLDNNQLTNASPKLFCNNGTNEPPVFDNMYSPVVLDSQNKLMTDLSVLVNNTFNAEIDVYKPLLLGGLGELLHALGLVNVNFTESEKIETDTHRYYKFKISDTYEGYIILNRVNQSITIDEHGNSITVPGKTINIAFINIENNQLIANSKVSEYFELESTIETLFVDNQNTFYNSTLSKPLLDIILEQGQEGLFKLTYDTFLAKYVQGYHTFIDNFFADREKLNNIPLTDTAHNDGGLLCIQEVFEDYKLARDDLQCYVDLNAKPDSHQIAKLTALYELLINATAVQEILKLIFIVSQISSYEFEHFEQEQLSQIISQQILQDFENSLTNVGNLQLDYTNDLQLIYKFDLIRNKQSVLLEKLNGEGIEVKDIISYFLNKYYSLILDRVKQRISVAMEGLNFNFNESFNETFVQNYPLYENILFDSIDKFQMSPKSWALHEEFPEFMSRDSPNIVLSEDNTLTAPYGFIAQTYVDIRQTANDKYLEGKFLPVNGDGPEWPHNDYFILTPNNDRSNNGVESPAPLIGTILQGNKDDKAAEVNNYINNFLRSQGKISVEDFKRYYHDQWIPEPNQWTDSFAQVKELFQQYGPKVYFEKVSVGRRLSLVIPFGSEVAKELDLDMVDDLLFEYLTTVQPLTTLGNSVNENIWGRTPEEIKYFLKEKILNYQYRIQHSQGQLSPLILIPVLEKETDMLDIIYEKWVNNPTTYDWPFNLYSATLALAQNNLPDVTQELWSQATSIFKEELIGALMPFVLGDLMRNIYGDNFNILTSATRNQTINLIHTSKAVINEDWDTIVTALPNDDEVAKQTSIIKVSVDKATQESMETQAAQETQAGAGQEQESAIFNPPAPSNFTSGADLWNELVAEAKLETPPPNWTVFFDFPDWATQTPSERLKLYLLAAGIFTKEEIEQLGF